MKLLLEKSMSKPKPKFITFTGIDERTDLIAAYNLARKYPIEWGVLYSPSSSGKKPRYPSTSLVLQVPNVLDRTAIHLCGAAARSQNDMEYMSDIYDTFGRVQINLPDDKYNLPNIQQMASMSKVIVQSRDNEKFDHAKFGHDANLLFDKSGGKGEKSNVYPTASPRKLVGYAGGFTPDNVAEFVSNPPTERYWIDMESGVRTDDWLDLNKCEAVCRAVYG